jgi:hypothetical protein
LQPQIPARLIAGRTQKALNHPSPARTAFAGVFLGSGNKLRASSRAQPARESPLRNSSASGRRARLLKWPNATGEAGELLGAEAFLIECEKVISSENQGWMARWLEPSSGSG